MLIGTCGFHCWENNEKPQAEIGYDLKPEYWNQGHMSEAIKPIIDFGFDKMGLEKIYTTVDIKNKNSIRFLEKLGFSKIEQLVNS